MTISATTQPPPPELDDGRMYQMAEDFLDDLLSAADVDTIGAANWWDRATSALRTAAGSTDTWGAFVARACRKLQVETPNERLSERVAQLRPLLEEPNLFRRWARLVERDALYITALVRERRGKRGSGRKPTKAAKPETSPSNVVEQSSLVMPNTSEEPECLPF